MPTIRTFVKLDAETERAAIVIAKGKISAERREVTLSTMAKIEFRIAGFVFRIAGIVFRTAGMPRLC